VCTAGATATAASYWRSLQRYHAEEGDTAWSCENLVSHKEILEFAQRNRLFEWGRLDVQRVRQWHLENHNPGKVVLRECELQAEPDESWREGYFLYSEGVKQQVFVRGTSNQQDLMLDFWLQKTWDEECGCYLHAGFAHHAARLLTDLEPLLDKHAAITLSGHSMGGAVATIMAMKLVQRGFVIERVVTFGTPKVTNPEGCAIYRKRIPVLRVCHEDDVVAVLPPISIFELVSVPWTGVYEHFGHQMLLVPGSGCICFLKGETEEQWWQNSFWLNLPALVKIQAHKMDTYIEFLARLCEGDANIVPYNQRNELQAANKNPR